MKREVWTAPGATPSARTRAAGSHSRENPRALLYRTTGGQVSALLRLPAATENVSIGPYYAPGPVLGSPGPALVEQVI